MKTRMTVLSMLVAVAVTAAPLGTEFTYQGVLSDAGAPASGVFDFRFLLYDADVGGSQTGPIVTVENLTVTDGRFTTQLDFGTVFDGTALWLEVGVRDDGSGGIYTVLQPRQELTAAPFAQHAASADVAMMAGHSATADVADWADDSDFLNGQHGVYYLAWSNFIGIPTDIADGDDDTLSDLSCSSEEIARWTGSAWNCSSDDDTPYARTYVVGPVGSPTENGTALRNAIAAITPPTSQEEAVLVKLEPGLYDLAAIPLDILGWMTLEGAGRGLTKVTGAGCSLNGVIRIGSGSSGVRSISIENTCPSGTNAVAVRVDGPDGVVERARIESIGSALNNRALTIDGAGSGLRVNDVEVLAEGGTTVNVAISNSVDNTSFEHVDVEAVGGVYAYGVYNNGDSATVRSSRLKASLATDTSYAFHGFQCSDLTLDRVFAEGVVGADPSNGISLQEASATLVGIRAIGSKAINIYNCGSVAMDYVIVEGGDVGINAILSTSTVMHSRVDGATNSVYSGNSSTISLEGVIMHGGPASGVGLVTCTGCMRNGTFSASVCP